MAGVGEMKQVQLVLVENAKRDNGTWGLAQKTRYNLWANVEKKSGSRSYQQSRSQLGEGYEFRTRYFSELNVNAKWKVVYDGKEFAVSSISKVKEKSFWWVIEASTKHS